MTIDQRNQFKFRMENELFEIGIKLQELRGDLLDASEVHTNVLQDGLDHARQSSDLNARLTINDHYLLKRNQLRSALQRIQNGTFGVCEECGEDIDPKRIALCPSYATCIGCQKKLEAQFKPQSDSDLWITDQALMNYWLKGAA